MGDLFVMLINEAEKRQIEVTRSILFGSLLGFGVAIEKHVIDMIGPKPTCNGGKVGTENFSVNMCQWGNHHVDCPMRGWNERATDAACKIATKIANEAICQFSTQS